ncbi:MAG TPA: nitroreductase [Candidatus Dorea gallistercoris]|uniref:Nitroreductase n=1 Tax=Candidatus Dorea gallistercoris TaxID=2838542 RepID=A0A9D1UEK4_9FIRM|nr:nitroreductase [Candidatus Dorea gallistercoris]
MEIMEAMKQRHSVRQYTDQRIEKEAAEKLQREIDACNKESGLHIQLVTDEPKAFDGFMAHYGKFSGVKNYIALIGKKGPKLEETCGYYGERLVLLAQQLGLNSCWVAMTYSKIKGAYEVKAGEKLCCVISIGYGVNQGVSHKVKKVEELCQVNGQMPQWFRAGVEAAQLAPTAMNQQKFYFVLKEDQVAAKTKAGFYTKVDLGIAKYHFEIGAGVGNDWKWAQ